MLSKIYKELLEDAFNVLEEDMLENSHIVIKEMTTDKTIELDNLDELIRKAIIVVKERTLDMSESQEQDELAFMEHTIAYTIGIELLKEPISIVLKQLIVEEIKKRKEKGETYGPIQ